MSKNCITEYELTMLLKSNNDKLNELLKKRDARNTEDDHVLEEKIANAEKKATTLAWLILYCKRECNLKHVLDC